MNKSFPIISYEQIKTLHAGSNKRDWITFAVEVANCQRELDLVNLKRWLDDEPVSEYLPMRQELPV
jgi:hypothetical protein